MKPQIYHLLFCLLFVVSACDQSDDDIIEEPVVEDQIRDYLFLGHIYETPNTIDSRIASADLSGYQQIWLGGDVCAETTEEESTLDYLDDLFDLGSNTTHWTLGNHDLRNGNLEWITLRTGRKTFYTHHFDGITLLILNTNFRGPEDCDMMDEQINLIRSVADTISNSSHLIVLTHHIVWGAVDSAIQPAEFSNIDGSWTPLQCDPVERFEDIVLPELIKVQEKNIEVFCIAGDMGQELSLIHI